MATITKSGQEAREALIKGVNELANIVTITLGPKGRNVVVDKRWSSPTVLHDGVSVAKAIHPKDPFEAMGAEMVKESASKTADVAGDGTTTATLLAQAIINAGNQEIIKGANPMPMAKGIEKAVSVVVDEIKNHAKALKNKTETAQIATISAASPEIGNLIAEALEKVGKNGVITVDEGATLKTEIEYKEGMEFEKGYQTSAFVTNKDKLFCEIENPYILFADFSISSPDEMANFLDKFIGTTKSKNIVFITDMIEDKALMTLVLNGQAGRAAIKTCAIQAPGIGEKRKAMLEDMAILTGGQAAFKDNGLTLENIPIEALGQCDKIWSDTNSTRIIGGKGDPKLIDQRVTAIKKALAEEKSDFEKEKLHERLAKLTGGVAVIKVGGQTEIEMKERKERVIDAVAATKAAVEEGIVAGGGITFLMARKAILPLLTEAHGDFGKGLKLVYDALEQPIIKLLSNSGIARGKELPVDGKTGINVETGEQVDMFKAGIIDPAKVNRQVIENAASVAAMILTNEAAVVEIPEDKKSPLEQMQM